MMMVKVFHNFDYLFLVLTTVSTKLAMSSHQTFRAINWLRKTKTTLSVRRALDLYRRELLRMSHSRARAEIKSLDLVATKIRRIH